jgi:hypothetical protein
MLMLHGEEQRLRGWELIPVVAHLGCSPVWLDESQVAEFQLAQVSRRSYESQNLLRAVPHPFKNHLITVLL